MTTQTKSCLNYPSALLYGFPAFDQTFIGFWTASGTFFYSPMDKLNRCVSHHEMLVQYRFNVYFLPSLTAMHWLQIIATSQIFLNFRKSQIHAKILICLIIFKEKWSLKKVTRKSKFKVYGYITSLTTKSTWNQNFQVVFFRLVIFQLTVALLSLGYAMTNDLPVYLRVC